jgi:hypothetical protein
MQTYKCVNNGIYIWTTLIGTLWNLVVGKEYEIEKEKIAKFPKKNKKKTWEIKEYE